MTRAALLEVAIKRGVHRRNVIVGNTILGACGNKTIFK